MEEQVGGAESSPGVNDDACAQSTERKDDNMVTSTEESEWDKLLRVR